MSYLSSRPSASRGVAGSNEPSGLMSPTSKPVVFTIDTRVDPEILRIEQDGKCVWIGPILNSPVSPMFSVAEVYNLLLSLGHTMTAVHT